MSLGPCLLVDAHVLGDLPDLTHLPSGDSALDDLPRRIPTQAQDALSTSHSQLAQHADRERLEKDREPRLHFCPREPNLTHSVLATRDSRRPRVHQRRVLHRVQMSPCSLFAVVVQRTDCSALRTQPPFFSMLDPDMHFALGQRQLHSLHYPRRTQPQQLPVHIRIAHLPIIIGPSTRLNAHIAHGKLRSTKVTNLNRRLFTLTTLVRPPP